MSVVFAMLASYFLSRTLVPTMVLYLLAPEARAGHARDAGHDAPIRRSLFGRIGDSFEAGFVKLNRAYEGALDWALEHKWAVIIVFLAFAFSSLALYPFVGRDFFPTVDAGQLRLHVRAPAGTRIEETEQYFQRVEDYIRQVIPANEISVIVDNIGLPAPIDIQVTGPLAESEKNLQVARQIAAELRGVPGAVDAHVQQILDAPRIMVDSDRALAQQVGLTQRDVAGSLLISLTGSGA